MCILGHHVLSGSPDFIRRDIGAHRSGLGVNSGLGLALKQRAGPSGSQNITAAQWK